MREQPKNSSGHRRQVTRKHARYWTGASPFIGGKRFGIEPAPALILNRLPTVNMAHDNGVKTVFNMQHTPETKSESAGLSDQCHMSVDR